VNGSNFFLGFTSASDIGWDKTVAGSATKAQMQWGPKGGPVVNGFPPSTLKPSTAYQFRVQDCDAITYSPWSDWLEVSTESSGSANVKLWLDNNTAQPIGTAPLGPEGGFVIKATIPTGTAPGNHTINAAAGNKPEASAQIIVAGQGGSGVGATISVMNTTMHTAFKPPINLLYPSTFRLRGDGFAPGTTVTVHLDTPTGPQLGTAIPNNAGIFLGNFTIPSTSTGPHTLVAVQVQGGLFRRQRA
jgi:hypothetical protein